MAIQSNFPNIKPSLLLDFANVKALDPRITFTRASTATFYDGKTVAKAEENLLVRSQEFDNASWTLTGLVSRTANTSVAPDGTTTADTLTEDSANALHRVFQQPTTVAQSYAVSCFFKAGTRSWAYIRLSDSGGAARNAFFDVSTGVLGAVDSGLTSTITSVGNGWYRCVAVITAALAGINTVSFGMSNADNTTTYTGDGTSTLLIWGAQLEQRSSVTAYTPTTTAPITNYIPVLLTAASGVPRFEHNPVTGESLGLEIEEQRTNLLLRSEEFDNASWGKINATITGNATVAPNGSIAADKIIATTTNGAHYVVQTVSGGVSGTAYTLSVFAKAAELPSVRLELVNGAFPSSQSARFNLTTTAVTTVSGSPTTSITSVGNGWYRCSITATATVTDAFQGLVFASQASTDSFAGNDFNGIFIWGAQLEAGAFPTSYNPTVAAQVTRSADAASMTGTNFSSWYRADEGTLYAEVSRSTTVASTRILSVSDGGTSNFVDFRYGSAPNLAGVFEVANGGASQAVSTIESITSAGTFSKYAGAYRVDSFASVSNGGTVVTDASGTVPVVSQLNIGARGTGAFPLTGTIKKIAFYPQRVTNAQLSALTS